MDEIRDIDLKATLDTLLVVLDERTDATRRLSDNVMRDGALVPSIVLLEIGSSLLMAERRKRIGARERSRAIDALEKLELEVDALTAQAAWRATSRLAEVHRLTLYDAGHLELTLRSRLPLATFDADLIRAASETRAALVEW